MSDFVASEADEIINRGFHEELDGQVVGEVEIASCVDDNHSEDAPPARKASVIPSLRQKYKALISTECPFCRKRVRKIAEHMRVHTGETPFQCTFCPRSFSRRDALTIHTRLHTNERPYACSKCSKRFTSSNLCRAHEKSHAEGRPYACLLCHKTYSNAAHLKRHSLVHSGDIKRFGCTQCDARFNTRAELKSHDAMHSDERPFACDQCSRTFKRAQDRREHVVIVHCNNGERAYACELCSKRFRRRGNLKEHMLVHSGAKKHQCFVCATWFRYKSALNLHTRRKHGGRMDVMDESTNGSNQNLLGVASTFGYGPIVKAEVENGEYGSSVDETEAYTEAGSSNEDDDGDRESLDKPESEANEIQSQSCWQSKTPSKFHIGDVESLVNSDEYFIPPISIASVEKRNYQDRLLAIITELELSLKNNFLDSATFHKLPSNMRKSIGDKLLECLHENIRKAFEECSENICFFLAQTPSKRAAHEPNIDDSVGNETANVVQFNDCGVLGKKPSSFQSLPQNTGNKSSVNKRLKVTSNCTVSAKASDKQACADFSRLSCSKVKTDSSQTNDFLRCPIKVEVNPDFDEAGNSSFETECNVCRHQVSDLKDHMHQHAGIYPFQCSVCWNRFRGPRSLASHMKLHPVDDSLVATSSTDDVIQSVVGSSGERRHSCSACSRVYATRSALRNHVKQVHAAAKEARSSGTPKSEQPLTCPQCSGRFKNHQTLKIHMRGFHPDVVSSSSHPDSQDGSTSETAPAAEKSYDCPVCGKHFIHRSKLKEHAECHSDERPYVCPECSKSFRHKSNLRYHIQSAHRSAQ